MKRLGFILSAVFGALTLLIGFGQGCHQGAKFSSSEPAGTLARTDSGNGGVYDGKPDGNYYHFLPEFKCEGADFPQEILLMTQASATLTRSTLYKCASSTSSVPLDQIDYSPYQSGVIGYQASIFESRSSLPARTPDRLVEAWCRDTTSPFGFETIGYYDRVLRKAQQEVYYTNAQGQTRQLPPFDVSRLIENRRIHYQRDQFDLSIRRQELGSKDGLYRGHLSLVVDGQRHTQDIECRLGAELDAQLWPVPLLSLDRTTQVRVSPDRSRVFASLDPLGGGPDYLASRPLAGGGYGNWNVLHQLNTGQFFVTVPTNFVLSPDQTKLMYAINVPGLPGNVGLFHYDIPDGNFALYPQAGPHSPVLPTFSEDGSKFLMESSFISPAGLYAGTTAAQSLVQISRNPLDGSSLNYVVNSHAFVPGTDKVMFEVYQNSVGIFVDIYISDLSGSSLEKVVPQDPNLKAVEGNFYVSDDGTTVHFAAMDKNTSVRGTFLMNVDGSNLRPHSDFEWSPRMQEMGTGCWRGQYEIEPDNLYRCNYSEQAMEFLRLDNFNVFSTPKLIDFDRNFVRAKQPVVGRISPTELVEFDAGTGAMVRSVCANGQELAAYQRLSTGAVLVIRKALSGEAEVLLANSGNCAVVNRLPAGVVNGKIQLVASPSGRRVAMIANRPLADGSLNEILVYIPLDGRPPIRVDAPATVAARAIRFAQWVLDDRALLYSAPHARVEEQLFLWTVPSL